MSKNTLTKEEIKKLLEATGKFVGFVDENGIYHTKFKPWDAYMTIPGNVDFPKLMKWICSVCTKDGRIKGKIELKRAFNKLMS